MNILFVWERPFKNAGGVGRVTEVLADQFIKEGHSVNYFCYAEGEPFTEGGITQLLSTFFLPCLISLKTE